jgi:uncharacterized membrane protein
MQTIEALNQHIEKDGFRLRGTAMSRVDGFSDVVFGFALTLLVVSLEVPHTFQDLNRSLHGFIPFAICFVMLILIWYSHYKFFRRYGLHDLGTICINATLLFVVLFFVYPMKFLFTNLIEVWTGNASGFGTYAQVRELMVIYGLGFTLVYLLFAALYWNAWRQRQTLDLTAVERFLTRSSMFEYGAMSSVGMLSIAVATLLPQGFAGLAGFVYVLLSVVGSIHGRWQGRMLKRLREAAPLPAGMLP